MAEAYSDHLDRNAEMQLTNKQDLDPIHGHEDEAEANVEGADEPDRDELSPLDDKEGVEGPAFDWIVFVLRASALVTIGAMLITSVDLSRNQGADWLTVMRLAILPFVGGMLLLAAAELADRRGD